MELPHDAVWEWLNPDTPCCHHMPKQPVPNGAIIRYPVELLQHEGSPIVFKTVMVPQQEGLEVKIDRCCLFAYDVMMVSTTDEMFFGTPQQAGLVCPCCNTNQQQWDLEHNIGNRMSNTNQQQYAPSWGSSERGWVLLARPSCRLVIWNYLFKWNLFFK